MENGVPMKRVEVEAVIKPWRILNKDPNGIFFPITEPLLPNDTSGSHIRPELQLLLINGVEDFAPRGGQVIDDALVFVKIKVLGDLCRELSGYLRFVLFENHELFDIQKTIEGTLHNNIVSLITI